MTLTLLLFPQSSQKTAGLKHGEWRLTNVEQISVTGDKPSYSLRWLSSHGLTEHWTKLPSLQSSSYGTSSSHCLGSHCGSTTHRSTKLRKKSKPFPPSFPPHNVGLPPVPLSRGFRRASQSHITQREAFEKYQRLKRSATTIPVATSTTPKPKVYIPK